MRKEVQAHHSSEERGASLSGQEQQAHGHWPLPAFDHCIPSCCKWPLTKWKIMTFEGQRRVLRPVMRQALGTQLKRCCVSRGTWRR